MKTFLISGLVLGLASVSLAAVAAGREETRVAEGKQVFDATAPPATAPVPAIRAFRGCPAPKP